MLSVNGLTKSFGSGANKLQVLKGVDMNIKQGEMVALMGPSGSGKSTLLNIIGGLLAGDGGSITLGDRTYGLKGPSSVVDVRRERIGWIFQDFHLLDNLSALDNVAMALELSGMASAEAEKAAATALEKVGLGDRMNFIPDQLSGGQQQRVAIARAIAGNRPVLLADEPTGNLDIASGKEVMALFHELCHDEENPISILMVTHDPDLASNADRMLLLKNGKTEASDIRSAWGLDAAEPEATEPDTAEPDGADHTSESPIDGSNVAAGDARADEAEADEGEVVEPAEGDAPATDGGEEE